LISWQRSSQGTLIIAEVVLRSAVDFEGTVTRLARLTHWGRAFRTYTGHTGPGAAVEPVISWRCGIKRSSLAFALALATVALPWLLQGFAESNAGQAQQGSQANQPAQSANQVVQPLGQQGLPAPNATPLEAAPVAPKDRKLKEWKVKIPTGLPLATPAVVPGKVFLGAGFGSHEFYALDAATGKVVWEYKTADDGPTAAVVQDGYVAFNTESCELEIITIAGKPVWKKWLGDPLMSMPAIDQGKVYMVYPDSKGDHQHHLACFDLKTGKEFWKKPIVGEIITAPVAAAEHVYLAALEGTLYCFGQHDGELLWKQKVNATSSPVVWQNRCYFSRREEVAQKGDKKVKQQTEQLAGRGIGIKDDLSDFVATARSADYLDINKRLASPVEMANQTKDAGVGFGVAGFGGGLGFGGGGLAGAPAALPGKGDAKIMQAMGNVGQASVVGVWSYQGSKPFIYKGRLYNVMGDTVQCVDPKTGKIAWKKAFSQSDKKKAGDQKLLDSVLTPPALVNDKVFLGTSMGQLVCLSAQSGDVIWKATVGEPIVFQPAVAKGRV
jgi:Ca-activated chloride channel family protein